MTKPTDAVSLYTARVDEKGREVHAARIPFRNADRAQAYIDEVERIAKAMKCKVKRVFRIEPAGRATNAERHEQTAKLG